MHIKHRWPEVSEHDTNEERPVFIFSAGWRSGSTLLQRLIMSSGEVVLWGEPLGDSGLLARLAYSISIIDEKWPPETFFSAGGLASAMKDQWIANLTPAIKYAKASHRSLFREWLRTPAWDLYGIKRWGLKEVRFTIDHARYLKWLFPNARFIFIVRNPLYAYRSWRGNRWRSLWPDYYSKSPIAFSKHWCLLVKGFIAGYRDVDGILVKYEDLIAGKLNLDEIAQHLGVTSLDATVLSRKIAAPPTNSSQKHTALSHYEKLVIEHNCNPLLKQLKYLS